ncbi:TPA: Lrp/AsnC family transcriptional regulator [Candidatus Woesearchaeota archaeon]|nr:Lrp/AsnC family transcriptional regulator [Candidatus Woesearchaeota archaeon]
MQKNNKNTAIDKIKDKSKSTANYETDKKASLSIIDKKSNSHNLKNLHVTKLDLIDRKILFELDKNSRLPTTLLAKKLNISRETCKYRINNLIKQGIIERFSAIINPSNLGYKMYKIHLQLTNIGEEREKLYDYLYTHPNLYWIGICNGSWDLILTMFAPDAQEFYKIVNEILFRFRHIIARKVVGTFVDSYFYRKSFLTNEIINTIKVGGKTASNHLDSIDKKIIEVLSNDARIPITELAKKTGTSPGKLRHRIKKLEEKDIIVGYRIALNLERINMEAFKALIYFNYIDDKRERSLLEYLHQNPNTSYYLRVISPWEGEIEFIVENYNHFNTIINDLRKRFSDLIKNYESVFISKEAWLPGLYKAI